MTSRRPRLDLGTTTRIVVAIGALAIGLQQLNDNSFLTHLATGRLILEDGIPRADPYSFTAPGEAWVVQSWLPSLLYGIADRWGGGYGLMILNLALIAGLSAAVWRLSRPAEHVAVRFSITALALLVGAGTWTERPFLFGLACLAAALICVEEERDPRWLLPIFWVWVNSHGSFPIGLGLIAAFGAGRYLDGDRRPREVRFFLWGAAGCALGAINPLGPKLLVFPLELLSRNEQLQFIQEWRAPEFRSVVQRAFLGMLTVSILMLRRRPTWRFAIALIGVTVATLISVRNMALAPVALIAGLSLAAHQPGHGLDRRTSPPISASVVIVAALAVSMVVVAMYRPPFRYQTYPLAALSWLDGRGGLAETRVVAPDIVGNLRASIDPKEQIYVDDRVDMFPAEVINGTVTLLEGRRGWERILDDVEAEAVLWQSSRSLSALVAASPRWSVVYNDGRWMVAERAR